MIQPPFTLPQYFQLLFAFGLGKYYLYFAFPLLFLGGTEGCSVDFNKIGPENVNMQLQMQQSLKAA